MGYYFHKLKTIDVFNTVTIRVPRRWDCRLHGASWCCSEEEGVESGTLWITVDHFHPSKDSPLDGMPVDPNFNSRQFVNRIVEPQLRDFPLVESEILDVEAGHLWSRMFEDTEDGEWLRFFRYTFFLFGRREVAFIDFNLVILRSLADDPEFRNLVAIMDHEIRAARLEPFYREQDRADELRFGPLYILNVADTVKIEVPETLVERPESESRYTWQFAFDPEPAGARLWVDVKDNPIKDDAGARRTLEDEEYEDSIRQSLSDRSDAREVLRGDLGLLPDASRGIHAFSGLPQERPGMGRAEEWRRDSPVGWICAVFRGRGRSSPGASLPSRPAPRELLPTLL